MDVKKAPDLVKSARGHYLGLRKVPFELVGEPVLAVVDHYDTGRHGRLERFELWVPEGCEIVETPSAIYVRFGDKAWKVNIFHGGVEVPDEASVEEVDPGAFEYVKKLAEVLEA